VNIPVMRDLLETALTATEIAAKHGCIKAVLKLLEGSTGTGSGSPAIPPTGPGVPGVVGPSSSMSPQTGMGCPHPPNQRTALGGFGGTTTEFYCRTCGEQSATAAGAALRRQTVSLNSNT
jgi:hypothetical protein